MYLQTPNTAPAAANTFLPEFFHGELSYQERQHQKILDQIEFAFKKPPTKANVLPGQRLIKQGCKGRRTSLFPSRKAGGLVPLESQLELAHAVGNLERTSKNYRSQAIRLELPGGKCCYPDFVVLTNTGFLREDTEQQAKAKLEAVRALSASSFNGLSSKSIAASLHPRRASDAQLISRIRVMGTRLGYEAFANQSRLRRADVPTDSIHCPTLIVGSTHDALRPMEETNELANVMPGASLHLFHDSGHMIPLEQPQELAAVVIDWLNTIGIQ